MTLDLSEDYLVIDDPVTVTLLRKTGRATFAAGVVVDYVFMEEAKQTNLAGGSLLADRRTFFHLWQARLTAAAYAQEPKPGDVIQYGGVNYTVDEVEHLDRDQNGVQRYRCACTRE
jgi:hypothetical protein